MSGLLDQMTAAQRDAARQAESHVPVRRVTGREIADAMQAAGLLASPLPVIGDVAGLLGDAAMYATKPEERTIGNAAMTMLGALPFFPSAFGHVKLPKMTRVFHGSPSGPIADAPRLAPHSDLPINSSFSTTTSKKIADQYARGLLGMNGPGQSPAVTEFLLHGEVPSFSKTYDAAVRDAAARGQQIGVDVLDRYAATKRIPAVRYFDDGSREVVVLDPSSLVRIPNSSPIR